MLTRTLRSASFRLARELWRRPLLAPGSIAAADRPHRVPLEWWYVIAWLDVEGQRIGVELTVARYADPLGARLAGWAVAHALVTDDAYRVRERKALGDGVLDDSPERLAVAFRGAPEWSVETAPGSGVWRVRGGHDAPLDLILTSTRPAARWGDAGVMDYGGRESLAWVSWSRLAASGTLGGRPVTGSAWIDHQWGAAWLDGYRWKVALVQLDDGRDVLAFRMTDRVGLPVATYGGILDQDGNLTRVDTVLLDDVPPTLRSRGRAFRPTTRLRLGTLDLMLTPWRLDQHKVTGRIAQAFPDWWEGACDVTGTDGAESTSGRAFVEISG